MQVRVRQYNESLNEYKLMTYFNCEDYDKISSLLSIIKENDNIIEISSNDMAEDTDGKTFKIKEVSFVLPYSGGELLPHIAVDVEEYYV